MSEFESIALKRLQEIQSRLLESTPQLRDNKKPKTKFLDQSKESRPTTSNSIKRKRDFRDNNNSKAADLESKINDIKKQIESEREKCRQMERDMNAREDRYMKREKEYRKNLSEYEAELRARSNYAEQPIEHQFSRNMDKIGKLHNVIVENISNIQKKTSQILQEQEKDIKRQFETRMKEVNKDLEEEKKKKLEGVGNYAEKESQLTRELELMKASMDLIESKNGLLQKENYQIKHEFKSQQTGREILLKEIVSIKRENAQIMEEIAKYKEFTISMSRERSVYSPSLDQTVKSANGRFGTTGSVDGDKNSRYESVINRLKRMLEAERKNLKTVRTAYARELQGKTELEQILRQSVDEVKAQILRNRSDMRDKIAQFSPQDRERIIEMILSQERVLTLLYEKTFPSRAVTRQKMDSMDNSSEDGDNI